jgi:outer membrane protein
LAYACAHQPEIRMARARVAAAEREASVPRAQWLPQIGGTAQLLGATANNTTASYVSNPWLDIPRIGSTRAATTGSLKPYASTFVAVGAGQELFDFGRIAAQSAAADALVEVQKRGADGDELDLQLDVEEAYFAVQTARSIVDAAESAYDRARIHRDLAKAGVDQGLRSPIELTRAEADLGRFDVGRIRAKGGLATAQTVFAATMGSPEPAVDAAGEEATSKEAPPLAAALTLALNREPLLREAMAALVAQEAKTKAIGAELRPDFSLTATLSGRAGGAPPSSGDPAKDDGWLPTVPNWDVGVIFSWPIYDGTIVARRDASRQQEAVRRAGIDVTRQALVANVQKTYVVLSVARTALPSLQRALDAARANYAQADARFKAGLGTGVELADAETLRTDAEIQFALGRFEVARARAALGRAIAEEP